LFTRVAKVTVKDLNLQTGLTSATYQPSAAVVDLISMTERVSGAMRVYRGCAGQRAEQVAGFAFPCFSMSYTIENGETLLCSENL
jgi:hypothetical protein